ILFDDISFNYDDERYRSFKSILEGGIFEQPHNVMIVATSNRRHLIFEHASDTDDIYSRDDINESTSLYSRFGLVVGFYPMGKDDYLNIVKNYLFKYGLDLYDGWDKDAENFAMNRGGRNGRVAKQFAIYKKIYF
ncbi:MAG: ATP-binding protein, partial [Calditerrivibrio sp.]|nr:ATP-binding protein [Calditerrivibrio sp.]